MHKRRQQKIKRYRNSLSGKAERSLVIRRVLGFVVILAVLFGVGWLLAEPAINLATGLWYSLKNGKENNSSSLATSSSSTAPISSSQIEPESTPPQQPVEGLQGADGNWAFVALSAIDTLEKAEETAQDLAAQGIKGAIIQLKDERGYLYYQSNIALAKKQIAGNTLDAAQIVKAFTEKGITPIASIYAFKDPLASREDRSAAVSYNGQEGYLWLDNKVELGGSSWLSPYSQTAKQYISDIISEITAYGFKQIIVSGAHYPDTYGLETAVFAPSDDTRTKQQALIDCVAQWNDIANDAQASLWLEYPIEDVLDDQNKKTHSSPLSLGAENMLINFAESVQATQEETALPSELFAAAFTKAQQSGAPKLAMTTGSGVLSTEAAYSAASAAKDAGFTSFVVK